MHIVLNKCFSMQVVLNKCFVFVLNPEKNWRRFVLIVFEKNAKATPFNSEKMTSRSRKLEG